MTTTRQQQPPLKRGLRIGALATEAAPAGDPWAAPVGTNRPPPLRPDPARRSRSPTTPEITK